MIETEDSVMSLLHEKSEYAEILQRIVDFEEKERVDGKFQEPDAGWQWHNVQVQPVRLNALVPRGIVRVTFRSNRSTEYRLADFEGTKKALSLYQEAQASLSTDGLRPKEMAIPEDLFAPVVGYEDLKNTLLGSLRAKKPVHTLLYGPPSSAKSLFLMQVERLEGAKYALGSGISRAGLADFMLEHRPRFLLFDEIDKADREDLSVLLSLMATGRVADLKYGRNREAWLPTVVLAVANDISGLSEELLSRFQRFHLPPYGKEDFYKTVEQVLTTTEDVKPALATYIAEVCWLKLRSRDIRDAVRVARQASTEKDVDTLVRVMQQYRSAS